MPVRRPRQLMLRCLRQPLVCRLRAGPPPPAVAGYIPPPECAARSDLLGISRIVEIDTATGPRFGEQHKGQDFLNDGEVVLTFDDGPMRRYTERILQALDEQCTKATFFSVGRMAISDPAMLQEVARRGHTIGVHTWSHKKLPSLERGCREDRDRARALGGLQGARRTCRAVLPLPVSGREQVDARVSPRPGARRLRHSRRLARFPHPQPWRRAAQRAGPARPHEEGHHPFPRHPARPRRARCASLLAELKTRGYKVVHMIAKTPATTLPEYDAMAQKSLEAKVAARAANPMATRAATWPNQGAGESKPDEQVPGAARLPAKRAAAPRAPSKTSGQAAKKLDWANPDNEPWQLKTLSDWPCEELTSRLRHRANRGTADPPGHFRSWHPVGLFRRSACRALPHGEQIEGRVPTQSRLPAA